jgi:hypothetical protein
MAFESLLQSARAGIPEPEGLMVCWPEAIDNQLYPFETVDDDNHVAWAYWFRSNTAVELKCVNMVTD